MTHDNGKKEVQAVQWTGAPVKNRADVLPKWFLDAYRDRRIRSVGKGMLFIDEADKRVNKGDWIVCDGEALDAVKSNIFATQYRAL